jgi:hypothetical protein
VRRFLYLTLAWPLAPLAAPVVLAIALIARFASRETAKPRLVWGSDPIINNRYWSQAMEGSGYKSETYTVSFYSRISTREEWGEVLGEKFGPLPWPLKLIAAFCTSLFRYDIFFISYNGYFLGTTPLYWVQALAFRIAGKHTVLIPYGSDYFVYQRIRSTALLHALLLSYPGAARQQKAIARRVD